MTRNRTLAPAIAGLLLLVAAGAVLATRQSPAPERPAHVAASHAVGADDVAPTAEDVAHAADRLAASGIPADPAVLADLASRHGVGGAVRLVAWADATGLTVEELAAMREGDGTAGSGMGWGRMAKDLGVHPGLGSIMGNGGGQGREDAPGQQKRDTP